MQVTAEIHIFIPPRRSRYRRPPAVQTADAALYLSRDVARYRAARFEAALGVGVCLLHGALCGAIGMLLLYVAYLSSSPWHAALAIIAIVVGGGLFFGMGLCEARAYRRLYQDFNQQERV